MPGRPKASPPTCSYTDCSTPVGPIPKRVSQSGTCGACRLVLCEAHHPCARFTDAEFEAAVRRRGRKELWEQFCQIVSSLPLLSAAQTLRSSPCHVLLPASNAYNGETFSADPYADWPQGDFNYHVPIHFADGVRWLARIPMSDNPRQRIVTGCEIATLQVLSDIIPSLVPKAWKAADQDRFFFVEFKEGTSFSDEKIPPVTISDVAAAIAKLTSVSFEGIGSFHGGENGTRLGPVVCPSAWCGAEGKGPFSNSADLYKAAIDYYMNELDKWRNRGGFDNQSLIRAYLGLLEVRRLITQCTEMVSVQKTYLHHPDLHLGNMLFADGTLVAIIDWEGAFTTTLPELAVPRFLSPRELPWLSSELPLELSPDALILRDEYLALGREDLAAAVDTSLKHLFLKNVFHSQTVSVIKALTNSPRYLCKLRVLFLGVAEGSEPTDMDEWEKLVRERHGDDPGLAAFEERLANPPPKRFKGRALREIKK